MGGRIKNDMYLVKRCALGLNVLSGVLTSFWMAPLCSPAGVLPKKLIPNKPATKMPMCWHSPEPELNDTRLTTCLSQERGYPGLRGADYWDPRWCLQRIGLFWVAVKELELSYHNPETI